MSSSPLILVVEDDEADVLFLKRAFQKIQFPYPFRVAETGRKAVEYLCASGPYSDRGAFPFPSHLLLDLKLPEKSGLEILAWMRTREELRDLHVTILTSSSELTDVRSAGELGAECYLVKPMGFAALTELARNLELWVRTGEIPGANRLEVKSPPRRPS